jgi:hypothetical protein
MMRTQEERFYQKVEQPPYSAACWIWLAAKSPQGYGHFFFNGRVDKAHRASWEIHNGAIPDDLMVLHKCDNPRCVNPEHLFLGTHQDNADDKMRKGRHTEANKSRCKRGHALSGDNLYFNQKKNTRTCRECQRMNAREYDHRRRPPVSPLRGPRRQYIEVAA